MPVTMVGAHNFVVNDDIFFIVVGDALVAWDFVRHKQFRLSVDGVRAIVDVSFRSTCPHVVRELIKALILVDTPSISKRQWKWDFLSKLFHFGTSRVRPTNFRPNPTSEAQEYIEYCNSIRDQMPEDCFRTARGAGDITAPATQTHLSEPLVRLLEQRRSNRTFSGEGLSFSQVTTIIDETFRYREHDHDAYRARGLVTPTVRRSSPSGGSLQSCEGYLLARNVAGLDAGIYHFRSHSRTFGLISTLSLESSFGELCGGQMFADDLSALIVITCRFDKLMWKYKHSHSYRVALFDAGHLSQTVQLLATAFGLRTWVTAAFFDESIRKHLQLDKEGMEYPLIIVGLGSGPLNPFDVHLGKSRPEQA